MAMRDAKIARIPNSILVDKLVGIAAIQTLALVHTNIANA